MKNFKELQIDSKFSTFNVKFNSFKLKEILVENSPELIKKVNSEASKSYSEYRIKSCISICTFINNSQNLAVISSEGIYYQAEINEDFCSKTMEVSLNLMPNSK